MKQLLEKAATIRRFEYSPLGKELKKNTGTAKDHYKVFKDEINVNNNREDDVNAENGVKTENDEMCTINILAMNISISLKIFLTLN